MPHPRSAVRGRRPVAKRMASASNVPAPPASVAFRPPPGSFSMDEMLQGGRPVSVANTFYTYTYSYIYTYIYTHSMCACVCLCVCVCSLSVTSHTRTVSPSLRASPFLSLFRCFFIPPSLPHPSPTLARSLANATSLSLAHATSLSHSHANTWRRGAGRRPLLFLRSRTHARTHTLSPSPPLPLPPPLSL
jgi:hypothetical protein